MAGTVNKATLMGHLGRDPEIRNLPNDGRVMSLSIATTESYKDKASGEWKEKTQWHRVQIFADGLIKRLEKYARKGTKVYVEGQIETRKWTDKDGVEKYSTEIVLRPYRGEAMIVDKINRDGAEHDGNGSAQNNKDNNTVLDEEIPF